MLSPSIAAPGRCRGGQFLILDAFSLHEPLAHRRDQRRYRCRRNPRSRRGNDRLVILCLDPWQLLQPFVGQLLETGHRPRRNTGATGGSGKPSSETEFMGHLQLPLAEAALIFHVIMNDFVARRMLAMVRVKENDDEAYEASWFYAH